MRMSKFTAWIRSSIDSGKDYVVSMLIQGVSGWRETEASAAIPAGSPMCELAGHAPVRETYQRLFNKYHRTSRLSTPALNGLFKKTLSGYGHGFYWAYHYRTSPSDEQVIIESVTRPTLLTELLKAIPAK